MHLTSVSLPWCPYLANCNSDIEVANNDWIFQSRPLSGTWILWLKQYRIAAADHGKEKSSLKPPLLDDNGCNQITGNKRSHWGLPLDPIYCDNLLEPHHTTQFSNLPSPLPLTADRSLELHSGWKVAFPLQINTEANQFEVA